MLQHTILFSALVLWVASIFDSSLGNMIYLVWGMAFLFSIYSYSIFFASISLLMSISYQFIDTSSKTPFFATILPWIFGVLATLFVFMVGGKYLSYRRVEYTYDYSDVHNETPHRYPWLFF